MYSILLHEEFAVTLEFVWFVMRRSVVSLRQYYDTMMTVDGKQTTLGGERK